MSGVLGRALDAARHHASVWTRAASGRRPQPYPLGSGTLDADDVRIAREWMDRDHGGSTNPAEVAKFEAEFAAWNGSTAAFAFASGRESLSAIVDALGLHAGDEVVVPGYTCVVVPNALAFAGVTPVYADIELDTYGLDVNLLGRLVGARTRAIVIQHLYGLVCRDYLAILEFAKARGLAVIEDCAQATGAEVDGIKVGNRGEAAFYSLEQSKVLTTFQGGVAVARDERVSARLESIRDRAPLPDAPRTRQVLHNLVMNYHMFKNPQSWWRGGLVRLAAGRDRIETTTAAEIRGEKPAGYGARMPSAWAAVASNQLRKVDFYNEQRRRHAARWDAWCDQHGFARAAVIPGSTPVFLRYPVLATPELKRDRKWAKRTLDVELGVWFVTHLHPAERAVAGCPNAAIAVERCINFPTLLGDRYPSERHARG